MITENMTIREIIKKYPGCIRVLKHYKLTAYGCGG